ncbi:MAG TPA: cytochrome c biogenesis protein CcsA [Thermoanaerobaculia bacterium]|nr:cytochrome c biogenesis protein CcsA [Thermoanaerobaculia bacterium]
MSPNVALYVALGTYALGTLLALSTLFTRDKRPQLVALIVMIAGFVAHTIWIGTICVRTGHPPLTNLPETAAFMAWTIFAVELVLYIRYRVHAASFFVYPLVLVLLTISAVVGESFVHLDPALRSTIFTLHILLTTLGIAGLMIALAFTLLAWMQDRALKQKTRGRMWEWIPSLNVCRVVSYRALTIGFAVYTIGLLAGILWSYRTNAGFLDFRVKQIGAVIAWVLFAVLLQSYISGVQRARRTIFLSGAAFVAIVIAILGIRG